MVISDIKEKILDLFFPKKCVNCGRWGAFVCDTCHREMIIKSAQECPSCNAVTEGGRYCRRCRPKHALAGAVSYGYYKDPIMKKLIHALKYEGVFCIAHDLARDINDLLEAQKIKYDYIAFVPLSTKRKSQRGYNQSEELAKALSRLSQKPLFKGIKKIKNTKTQVGLARKERLKNLENAFRITSPKKITGKKILVVDDVLTTGTTLNECAKKLKESGGRTIWGLTIAKE